MTAVLFAAAHRIFSIDVVLAGVSGMVAAWASYAAITRLIGKRLAQSMTLWLMLALVVLALAPVVIFQVYAALGVVAIWTLCVAFQDVLR